MGRAGFSLAELMVAILVVACSISGVTSSFLSSARQESLIENRDQVSLALRRLLEELENYVAADPPQEAEGPASGWTLPGDDCDGCWALAAGRHDVTQRLPQGLQEDLKAGMSYDVFVEEVNGEQVRRVEARVDWNER